MEKKVIELFAGVGGFRVGLNNVKLENINHRMIKYSLHQSKGDYNDFIVYINTSRDEISVDVEEGYKVLYHSEKGAIDKNKLVINGITLASIFYMYDLEEYQHTLRDFYINLEELPGPIIEKEKELIKAIKDTKKFKYDKKYKAFNDKYTYLDDGKSAERVVKELIK